MIVRRNGFKIVYVEKEDFASSFLFCVVKKNKKITGNGLKCFKNRKKCVILNSKGFRRWKSIAVVLRECKKLKLTEEHKQCCRTESKPLSAQSKRTSY